MTEQTKQTEQSEHSGETADRPAPSARDGYRLRKDGAFAQQSRPTASEPPTGDSAPSALVPPPPVPPPGRATSSAAQPSTAAPFTAPLLDPKAVERLREDWKQVQYDFVDDPHQAVERADEVLDRAARRLSDAVQGRSALLRRQWQEQGPGSAAQDGGTPTEDLRLILHQYRALLRRVLDF
jgi:hypothetical protein